MRATSTLAALFVLVAGCKESDPTVGYYRCRAATDCLAGYCCGSNGYCLKDCASQSNVESCRGDAECGAGQFCGADSVCAVCSATDSDRCGDGASPAGCVRCSGQTPYSPAAKDASTAALVEISAFKKKVDERLVDGTATELDYRQRAGLSDNPSAAAVADVSRVGNSQIELLADEQAFALLEEKGVYPGRSQARLLPLMKTLDEQIDAGMGPESRRGAAALKVNNALLKLQIVLSRAGVFLKEFGATDQAGIIEGLLPKRLHRRAGDKPPADETPAPAEAQPADAGVKEGAANGTPAKESVAKDSGVKEAGPKEVAPKDGP